MSKDSQLDPKEVRKMKAKGGHTMAESALDGESRNNKKQSGNRHKCGNEKGVYCVKHSLFLYINIS